MPTPSPLHSSITAELRFAGCVFAEDEATLLIEAAASTDELRSMVALRVGGQPLEYVVGWADFCGLRVWLEPTVFVPRRRTELVVRAAAVRAPAHPIVVDLACGSGAVGAVLARRVTPARLLAVDIDPVAVRCARRNLEPVGGTVAVGDLYHPLPDHLRGRVDVLVANAPYVPTAAIDLMPPEARLYEASVALDGGADGLDVVRRVATGAGPWLAPGGYLLVESGREQAAVVCEVFAANALEPLVEIDDDLDATVVIGRRGGPGHRPV